MTSVFNRECLFLVVSFTEASRFKAMGVIETKEWMLKQSHFDQDSGVFLESRGKAHSAPKWRDLLKTCLKLYSDTGGDNPRSVWMIIRCDAHLPFGTGRWRVTFPRSQGLLMLASRLCQIVKRI